MKLGTTTNIILGFIIIAVFIGGGVYVYTKDTPTNTPSREIDTQDNKTGDSEDAGIGISGVEVEDATEGLPDVSRIPVPSLDRPIVFPATTPQAVKEETEARIRELSAILKEDPNSITPWIELGLLRKSTNDFEGARQAWEYAAVIRPGDFLPFGNLGNLYAYYLNDPAKAEQNFLRAIKNDPSQSYLYFQTHEFYRDIRKDAARAKAIVEEGVRANPGDEDLKALLASLS